jgi:hypothetical protein
MTIVTPTKTTTTMTGLSPRITTSELRKREVKMTGKGG